MSIRRLIPGRRALVALLSVLIWQTGCTMFSGSADYALVTMIREHLAAKDAVRALTDYCSYVQRRGKFTIRPEAQHWRLALEIRELWQDWETEFLEDPENPALPYFGAEDLVEALARLDATRASLRTDTHRDAFYIGFERPMCEHLRTICPREFRVWERLRRGSGVEGAIASKTTELTLGKKRFRRLAEGYEYWWPLLRRSGLSQKALELLVIHSMWGNTEEMEAQYEALADLRSDSEVVQRANWFRAVHYKNKPDEESREKARDALAKSGPEMSTPPETKPASDPVVDKKTDLIETLYLDSQGSYPPDRRVRRLLDRAQVAPEGAASERAVQRKLREVFDSDWSHGSAEGFSIRWLASIPGKGLVTRELRIFGRDRAMLERPAKTLVYVARHSPDFALDAALPNHRALCEQLDRHTEPIGDAMADEPSLLLHQQVRTYSSVGVDGLASALSSAIVAGARTPRDVAALKDFLSGEKEVPWTTLAEILDRVFGPAIGEVQE